MSKESDDAIIQQALAILNRRTRRGSALTSPELTRSYLAVALGSYEHEVFFVVFLDNQHRVIDKVEMFRGTIDGASVHPREVVKQALKLNCAAVIFAHNHPSGICEPSISDKQITDKLKSALSLMEIRVLDHFICAGGSYYSFAENNLI